MTFPWLTLAGLLPIAGSLLVLVLGGRGGKAVALCVALADLVLGVAIWPMDSLAERHSWIGAIGAWYALDADGMTKLLVLLTVILVPIVLLAEWRVGDGRVPRRRAGRPVEADGVLPPRWSTEAFMALALMLEGFTLYVFMASDLLLFYIFFEATLIPMYFLVAGWGGPGRTGAALKFLLYSLLGGLVLLAGVIGMYALSAGRGAPSLLTSDLTGLPISDGHPTALLGEFIDATRTHQRAIVEAVRSYAASHKGQKLVEPTFPAEPQLPENWPETCQDRALELAGLVGRAWTNWLVSDGERLRRTTQPRTGKTPWIMPGELNQPELLALPPALAEKLRPEPVGPFPG